MGFHYGVIVARTDASRLVDAINARVSLLEVGEMAAKLDDIPLEPTDAGWGLAFGERDGVTYLFDSSFVLASDADLIQALAAELGTTVAGFGAETTSGSYFFNAAERDHLIRGYWTCHGDMYEPWSRGTVFATEAAHPFDGDLDGDGLCAAAATMGFDLVGWLNDGPWTRLTYVAKTFPPKGPLREDQERFSESVRIPKDRQPKPTVVVRSADGTVVSTGKPKRKKWLGLFG